MTVVLPLLPDHLYLAKPRLKHGKPCEDFKSESSTCSVSYTPFAGTHYCYKLTSPEGIVIVEIGLDKIKHYVHKALLVHHSEYFWKPPMGLGRKPKSE
jgi:hypothetical protein